MRNIKLILFGIIAFVLFFLVMRLLITKPVQEVDATYTPKVNICHFDGQSGNFQTLNIAIPASIAHLLQHDKDYAGVCKEPEPEVCEDETAINYGKEEECEYEEPEEPETPIETGNGGTPPTFQGSTTEAPGTCSDKVPGSVANINVLTGTPNDGKVEVQWSLPEGASQVHIRYGKYSDEGYPHALLNTPNDGNEVIGELTNGTNYKFQVAGVNGCAVGNYSKMFDPKP